MTSLASSSGSPMPSLEAFLERMEPRLRRILDHTSIPREDAEDLLQQTLMSLLHNWEQVREPRSWVLGVLRHHCLMYWRSRRRQLYSSVDTSILEWLAAPVEAPQERREMLRDVERALERLPQRCRSILRLRFGLGFRPPEVADRLGYRPSSIGKLTHRCLAALCRELGTPLADPLSRKMLIR